MYEVTIISAIECEVLAVESGMRLTCDKLSGRWHAPFAVIDGAKNRTPDCFVLADEIVDAIEDAYAAHALGGEA